MGLGSGQHHALAALPLGKTQDHCTGGWVGIRASVDGHRKSHPPLGFDPQTVQPIVNRYTNYAVLAAKIICIDLNVSDTY